MFNIIFGILIYLNRVNATLAASPLRLARSNNQASSRNILASTVRLVSVHAVSIPGIGTGASIIADSIYWASLYQRIEFCTVHYFLDLNYHNLAFS